VFDDHIHHQSQHAAQAKPATRKLRTHGRSYSFHNIQNHNVQGKRSNKITREQLYSNQGDEVQNGNDERVKHISGEITHPPSDGINHIPLEKYPTNPPIDGIHHIPVKRYPTHPSSGGIHHISVERYPNQYTQVTTMNDTQNGNGQFRCQPFINNAEVAIERYSRHSSGYWSGSAKRNEKYHHRNSFQENQHTSKHSNSLDNPNIRLTKAGTLARELCHPAVRVKPMHMSSLHNLCENNHANHRSIFH
jgi:hypothetical protein